MEQGIDQNQHLSRREITGIALSCKLKLILIFIVMLPL